MIDYDVWLFFTCTYRWLILAGDCPICGTSGGKGGGVLKKLGNLTSREKSTSTYREISK